MSVTTVSMVNAKRLPSPPKAAIKGPPRGFAGATGKHVHQFLTLNPSFNSYRLSW